MFSRQRILTGVMLLLCGGCCCQRGVSERNKLARSLRLVREITRSIEELDETERALLRRTIAEAGNARPNGANEALLQFLNNRGLLLNAALIEFGNIGDVSVNGRLEFLDEWGIPLIVAIMGEETTKVSLGNAPPTDVAVPSAEHSTRVLIWSVGFNRINDSGQKDDLANWKY